MGTYHVINGYRIEKLPNNKLKLELLKNGDFFTQVIVDDEEGRKERIETYLDSVFENTNGTGAGALITILYYIQNNT